MQMAKARSGIHGSFLSAFSENALSEKPPLSLALPSEISNREMGVLSFGNINKEERELRLKRNVPPKTKGGLDD